MIFQHERLSELIVELENRKATILLESTVDRLLNKEIKQTRAEFAIKEEDLEQNLSRFA